MQLLRLNKSPILGLTLLVAFAPPSEAQEFERLPAGSTAPLGVVEFPEFGTRPDRAARLVPNESGGYTVVDTELPDKPRDDESAPSDAEAAQGIAVLRSSARFLAAQQSLRFQLLYHLDEEGSMGFVSSDTVYGFELTRPNRFSVMTETGGLASRKSRIVGNGQYVLRREMDRIFAQPSPDSIGEIVQLEALGRFDGWGLEASRVLSLLDPGAIEDLLNLTNVYHGGVRRFGDVDVDRIVIRDRDQELRWDRIGWEVFIARGDRPVPVAIRLDQDDTLSYIADKQRFSDSWLHLTEWQFNDVDESTAFTEELTNQELVHGLGSMFGGERQQLNPMAGRDLPSFTARDQRGDVRESSELFAEQPRVLMLSDDRCHLVGAWWEGASELIERYDGRASLTVLHVGSATKDEALAELERWNATPDLWFDCSAPEAFSDGAFRVDWGGNRVRAKLGERLVFYVIGTDGRIHSVIDMGTGCFDLIASQLDGLLEGKDMVAINRELMAERNELKARQFADLRASFAPAVK